MKSPILIFLYLAIAIEVLGQPLDEGTSHLYIGGVGGTALAHYGETYFLFSGGLAGLYNWNSEYVTLSYNIIVPFRLNFAGSATDNYSSYDRIDLCYGGITQLSKKHVLFKHVYVSGSLGVSLNAIRYFHDYDAYRDGKGSKLTAIGFPIGIGLTSQLGESLHYGWEYKQHIVIHQRGYLEGRFVINVRLL